MGSTMLKWDIISTLTTILLGTASHFLYSLSGSFPAIGLFCPVNESVWEHVKLLYFPAVLASLVQYRLMPTPCAFLSSRCIGILAGCAAIPLLYYSYTSLLGYGFLAADMGIFVFSSCLCFALSHILTRCPQLCRKTSLWLLATAILGLCFMVFTFSPPHLPPFRDSVTGQYGA